MPVFQQENRKEWLIFLIISSIFLIFYFLPINNATFDGWSITGFVLIDNALKEALHLAKWYSQEHVILCLIPAFFIAGAIAAFVSQSSVIQYLGPKANKWISYGVSSVSGGILAVCSCTILPLFSGIYRMGAGLGPAVTFLYSGPAINIMAIILTANVLGMELGIARAVGAIVFSIIIGLIMQFIFRNEQKENDAQMVILPEENQRSLGQNALYFFTLVAILVFANWGKSADGIAGLIYAAKWEITSFFGILLGIILKYWFGIRAWKIAMLFFITIIAALVFVYQLQWGVEIPFILAAAGLMLLLGQSTDENKEWFNQTWDFAKQILPLLLFGVLIAGFLLGRPGHEGLIPSSWIENSVGGNGIGANFFAAIAGAFMYFATLTEIPILQGLIGAGMGKGPALALLLAGPALSLPNMLVIRTVMGTKKTIVFIFLVVIMSALSGMIYGNFF